MLGLLGVFFVFVLAELWRTLRDEDKARGEAFAVVGLAGGIRDREVVVRKGKEAGARVERVAPGDLVQRGPGRKCGRGRGSDRDAATDATNAMSAATHNWFGTESSAQKAWWGVVGSNH